MTTTETLALTLAQKQATGLRALADLLDAHPELAADIGYALRYMNIPVSGNDDPKGSVVAFIRAGMRHGAKVHKHQSEDYGGVELTWPGLNLHVYAHRDQVCERVVTGTETVTRTVPDPAALADVPTVEVTETVETVEWVCKPLLSDDGLQEDLDRVKADLSDNIAAAAGA